jgi:hypothetical protein
MQELAVRYEDVRSVPIAVVFRHLVLVDPVIANRVSGQLRDQSMALVQVVSVVGQHEVGRRRRLQRLENVLHASAVMGTRTVPMYPCDR